MTWLGLLLVGLGVTDLAFSRRRPPRVAEAVGAPVVVVVALLAGLTSPLELVGVLAVVVATVAWGEAVTYGFGSHRCAIPLLVLGAALLGALAATATTPHPGGVLGHLLHRSDLPLLGSLSTARLLLLAGAALVQLSTGNVLVRLVLGVTGTSDPARDAVDRGDDEGSGGAPSSALKGGRLLGPMERLFILGLGIAGDLTAAGIVIAAKGLLRFPELQSARGDDDATAPGIHAVTEYFLVGSFVSWSVSLACLALTGSGLGS